MPKAVILLATIATVVFLSPQAGAVDTRMRLQIAPKQCTIDTLNTGLSQVSVLQPEECRGGGIVPLEGTAPNPQDEPVIGVEPTRTSERDDHPGSQTIFENTIIEPIASLIGIGSRDASLIAPVAASTMLVSVVGVAVDLAFFQLRFTQWVIAGLRAGLANVFGVLVRIVLRR